MTPGLKTLMELIEKNAKPKANSLFVQCFRGFRVFKFFGKRKTDGAKRYE